jgi:putative flippase GtrA
MNAVTSPSPRPAAGLARTFGRHQVGAIVATIIDFSVMSALVRLLGVSAPLATAFGAGVGGITNFAMGRSWIFAASEGHAGHQAWRYAVVSGVSLLLNSLGEYILHDRLGIQYLLARVIVAATVSVGWNFPIQRAFVYRRPARPVTERSP